MYVINDRMYLNRVESWWPPLIVALQRMIERLQEDHQNAKLLLVFMIDMESVQTNIVFVTPVPAPITLEEWVAENHRNETIL